MPTSCLHRRTLRDSRPVDLNPTIVRQWQSYLEQTGKSFHPVWAPWHAFAKLPKSEFESRA
jgi:hypothetical protein